MLKNQIVRLFFRGNNFQQKVNNSGSMTFTMGNINLALVAAGIWQLATGRFSITESSIFRSM
jgi:hypothetical protein